MKRTFWVRATGVVVCLLFFHQVADAGQKRLGQAVLHILKVDQGTRMSGMGGTFVAISDNVEAIYTNPAGLTHVERAEYSFSHTRWIARSKFYSGAVACNTGRGIMGLSVLTYKPEEMEETTILQPLGTGRKLKSGDLSIGAAYARQITDKLSFGFMARWTQETLDFDRLRSFDINMGTFFYTGFKSLRLAMTFRNLGKDMKVFQETYRMPTAFNVAFAMEALGKKDQNMYLTITGESYYATDFANAQYRVGGEFWLQNALALRVGRKFKYDEETFSFGAGVKFRPSKKREVRADFAYTRFGVFDPPVRFSLSGSF
jgi:hypothetical protein